ncbi:MAG: hypothetical protein C5B49_15680 [Bdellovibrio sp.]|nr:MAG: hypothetical protein C5B49_15680 [Bdellovibrio sp.]
MELSCSKGSYVRSWVVELGRRLGVGACLSQLRRLRSEPYSVDQALNLKDIEDSLIKGEWIKGFVSMSEALAHWKAIHVVGRDETLLRHGQISSQLKSQLIRIFRPQEDLGVRIISSSSELMALVGLELGRGFVVRRVFRY